MTLRVGIIGVGRIGSMHAELLAFQVPGAALSCIHDADPARAAAIALRAGGARVAPSIDALLGADDVDAVAICSSTDTHVD